LKRAVRASYDAVADEYAIRMDGELIHKPFDRQLLDAFAEQVRNQGTVADLGCGPGTVTQYLHDRGVSMLGIDIAPRMIERAHLACPEVTFECKDFTRLEVADDQWIGALALYSLIHMPREDVQNVLRDIYRVLQPAGLLLIGFYVGSETRHATDWWERPVDLDFVFFHMSEMLGYVWGAGFDTELYQEREPYPEIEVQALRGYILARKPSVTLVTAT
jgi:ubiquinone/menaquinone biosynthesis C-methylase UbiE